VPWITAIVLLPLSGALSLLFVPPGALTQTRIYALVASVGTLGMTCAVVGLFDRGDRALQFRDHQAWVSGIGLDWEVGVDGISLWLLVLTAALFLLAIVDACVRMPVRPRGYLGLLLLAEAALLGLFSAGNLGLFYVFWEAMLVPFYFLIGMWGGPRASQATLKFVIYTMVGSLLMLVAVLATGFVAQGHTGQFTLDIQQLRGVAFTSGESTLLFAGFAAAFAIKLPLWPLHAWLPDAYSAAPIAITGLLAAVMSKAAAYGLLRIGLPVFPEGADQLALPLVVMALIGIVYGSLVAWRATTMRLLLGYSSLSHLGFIVLGIMVFDVQGAQGAVLQMVNHGIVVAAAFAIVGIIARGTGAEVVDDIGGLAARAPRLAGIFLIVAMAALAVPGSNAFVGEFFILSGVFRQDAWLAVLACIGILFAAVYMLRLYQTTMNGPLRGAGALPWVGRAVEVRGRDAIVLVPLVGAMLAIAVWPNGIVRTTTASLERALAPAQLAAGRPAEQIRAAVAPNPPREALPFPFTEE
jgi:NADH-quinone oxidoreductase subunit M